MVTLGLSVAYGMVYRIIQSHAIVNHFDYHKKNFDVPEAMQQLVLMTKHFIHNQLKIEVLAVNMCWMKVSKLS